MAKASLSAIRANGYAAGATLTPAISSRIAVRSIVFVVKLNDSNGPKQVATYLQDQEMEHSCHQMNVPNGFPARRCCGAKRACRSGHEWDGAI